jgi:mevalonate kinase
MLTKLKESSTAHGKVHLGGEYAVVYGQPAILLGIDKQAKARAYPTNGKDAVIHAADFGTILQYENVNKLLQFSSDVDILWEKGNETKNFAELSKKINGNKTGFLTHAVGKTLNFLDAKEGVYCIFNSNIPVRNGLGSSAALAVSVASAVSTALGHELSRYEVNNIAHKIERASHFTPSGGDNACATFGSIYFKNQEFTPITELHNTLQEIVMINTGPRPSTREMVTKVGLDYAKKPERFDLIFSEIGEIVESELNAIKQKNPETLIENINRNQELLMQVGVSTPIIDQLHMDVKSVGGALKLSGAGGGGYAIAFHPEKKELYKIVTLANRLSCKAEVISLKRGVSTESSS